MFQVSNCWFSVEGTASSLFPGVFASATPEANCWQLKRRVRQLKETCKTDLLLMLQKSQGKKTPFTLDVFKKPVVLSGGITNILTGERPITEPSTVPMLGSMIASQDFSLSSLPVFPIRHLGSIWGRGCWGAT